MSTDAPPPLPRQPAAEAARATDSTTTPGIAGVDDTGVPAVGQQDAAGVRRGFFRSLFDLSFRTFITRRLAAVFYVVGLMAIGIAFVVYLVTGVVEGIGALWFNPGAGISLIVATVILVPLFSFLAVIALRFVIEAVVALIAIAENTERTAANTRR
ncbi:hypothetical protein HDC37_000777 [Microbacterium sp. AK009]|uniref:DUF4282 domain-containing protein n=1 Tax=Microbacterium sp. AK009 TaxID=2723068 RepID=UPI0015CAC538|nr:DUF4282 domain-containing protein [Microbacterium sp. AK009]NYF15965.1 hypothetical protein [Microbacterium sp. AK009]